MSSDEDNGQGLLSWLRLDGGANSEYWHRAATKIRNEDPVHWVEHPSFNPFWVVSRHAETFAECRAVSTN